ncbi:hypothetical protein O181_007220 [Austropuccinia psidii MF-1]|uniref:Uncharacterized protein n=1 Tax=Austropuccinia psidii MF-1 TaxID=1389203 RepID=A0A9Q3BMI0_9BASI|nr:hypothetical protein [Austropuccinia psidii MF-1]
MPPAEPKEATHKVLITQTPQRPDSFLDIVGLRTGGLVESSEQLAVHDILIPAKLLDLDRQVEERKFLTMRSSANPKRLTRLSSFVADFSKPATHSAVDPHHCCATIAFRLLAYRQHRTICGSFNHGDKYLHLSHRRNAMINLISKANDSGGSLIYTECIGIEFDCSIGAMYLLASLRMKGISIFYILNSTSTSEILRCAGISEKEA